jgi:putative tryptophan/tyrosine transport system substrate-binding protein
MQRPLQRRYSPLSLVVCLSLTSLLLTACGGAPPAKTYTIGVVNYYSVLEPMLGGFKAQMAALGYVEGENITYIYHGILGSDPAVLGGEIKSLVAQKVNLLLAMGTPAALAAQKAMAGTHIPVVFTLVINPVKEGIVESLTRPGGNITGVQVINASPKAMEWLLKLVPSTKTVYVPYHPEDRVAVMTIKPLPEAAARLGVELVLNEVHSPEEVMAAIETLPKNAAILFIPTPGLTSRMSAISQFAIERGIPAGGYTLPAEDVLFTYGPNGTDQGKQVARLVDQILKGAKPADLPVQTAELFLRINLKTATAIGLDIPDEIIRQADTVMR